MADEQPRSSTRIGKVGGASLPQEFSLDLFLRNVTNRRPSWCTSTPACQWNGVTCTQEQVRAIHWDGHNLRGTILWSHLPVTTAELSLGSLWSGYNRNTLSGPIHVEVLPPQLSRLDLHTNAFTGEIRFANLPPGLEYLGVSQNDLHGSVDWTLLPQGLISLRLDQNSFSGQIFLTSLPSCLSTLTVSTNMFEGPVILTELPSTLTFLNLSKNKLSGSLDLRRLPLRLLYIYLNENHFNGLINLSLLPPSLKLLNVQNTSVETLSSPPDGCALFV